MSVVIVEEGEGLALTLQLEKLQKEWEEKKTQSVEVRKVLDDLKLHKLRMKRLAEELSVAEAWEIELEARRLRVEESLKPPLLGLFDKLESEEFVGDQLLREAFVSGGEDVFKTLESRASRVMQLERRALLMFVHLLLRLEAHVKRGYWAGQGGEAGQDGGVRAGQARYCLVMSGQRGGESCDDDDAGVGRGATFSGTSCEPVADWGGEEKRGQCLCSNRRLVLAI